MPIALTMLMATFLYACNPDADMETPSQLPPVENPDGNNSPGNSSQIVGKMNITIGTTTFKVTLADNSTAAAFGTMLPMTITTSEMNGNEKYYYLPNNLPTAAYRPKIIYNGDIMLYGSNGLVLFYKTVSTSYSYTKIGRIDDPSMLETALGKGDITIKFELINE